MTSLRYRVVSALFVASLMFAGCGGGSDKTNIGAACTADGGCSGEAMCTTAIAGGYCTTPCTMTGTTEECPSGSVCDTVTGVGITCITICKDGMECRQGIDCNGVSGSNVKGCKPR